MLLTEPIICIVQYVTYLFLYTTYNSIQLDKNQDWKNRLNYLASSFTNTF